MFFGKVIMSKEQYEDYQKLLEFRANYEHYSAEVAEKAAVEIAKAQEQLESANAHIAALEQEIAAAKQKRSDDARKAAYARHHKNSAAHE